MRHVLPAKDFLAGQEDQSAALCITDPPWALQGGGRFDDVAAYKREDVQTIVNTLQDLQRVLVRGGALYSFLPVGPPFHEVIIEMHERGWRFQRILTWEKGENGLGAYQNAFEPVGIWTVGECRGYERGGSYKSLLKFPRPAGRTAKPWQLYKVFLEMSSRPGELVLDPYCGTNPLSSACAQTVPARRWAASDVCTEAEVAASLDTGDGRRHQSRPLPPQQTQASIMEA